MQEQPQNKERRFKKLRNTKLMKRRLRKIESATLKHAHTFIVKRWENVREVRRHAIMWLLLLGTLIATLALQAASVQNAYTVDGPESGGTYTEGIYGQLDSLNPIFASSLPERSASRLLFASLLTYDSNGSLKGDLAESWQTADGGKRYNVTLKKDITWQNGDPITAEDVVFTINSIKNADTRSPLYASWRDITVQQKNEKIVEFVLPSAYAPFPHFLTVGILPADEFAGVAAADMRAAEFNSSPLASGPFEFRSLQVINAESGRSVVHMAANPRYHEGRTKLERFQLHIYGEQDALRKAITGNEVNAAANLSTQDLAQIENIQNYTVKDVPLNNIAMAIFKTTDGPLQDKNVRKALLMAINRPEVIKEALAGRATSLDVPIPPSLIGGTNDLKQAGYNEKQADILLTQAGWIKGADGKRAKDGQPLRLRLATSRSGDYPKVMEQISKQLNDLGVVVQTVLVNPEEIQQDIIAPRAYDVLLYELAIGSDPDVYAYWHSSQATSRGLNLANYSSGKADDALDSARARPEADLRSAKYRTFMEQWLEDTPGVVLYQSNVHYLTTKDINAVSDGPLVDLVDRYRNVQYWTVAEGTHNRTP